MDKIGESNQNTSLGTSLPTLSNKAQEMTKKASLINNQFLNNRTMNDIEEGIRLSNKETLNLQNTINSLDPMPDLEEKINAEPGLAQKKTFMDIFGMGRKKFDQMKMKNLEEINKFNLSIINNSKWGEDSNNRGKVELGNKSVNKPTLKELERTIGNFNIAFNLLIFIGFTMAHSKLPRQRIANSNARSYYRDNNNTTNN